mmetsp:Transcript_106888/g.312499  ORF Transcript_106888/g.312499 Transcript_106888/m.312499 type:complete len:338 (-) Transcript_106888:42-1055(-)
MAPIAEARLPLDTFLSPLQARLGAPEGTLFHVRGRGAARVVQDRLQLEDGRVAVCFEQGGAVSRVAASRLVPVLGHEPHRRALVLCADSAGFRSLARTQVLEPDSVLELGCSFGEATAVFGCRSICGVDVARGVLARAAERCPHARFEQLDALAQPELLAALGRELQPTACFVDLGGNREAQVLAPFLARLLLELPASCGLVVVKSRNLALAAMQRRARTPQQHQAAEPAEPLPRAKAFWASQLRRAALAASSQRAVVAAISCGGGCESGSGGDGELNGGCEDGESRLCFEFTNWGRCRRRRCTLRHLLPTHPDVVADALRRGKTAQHKRMFESTDG